MSTALPYERSKINREPSEGKERKWSKFLLSCSSSLGFVGTCQRLIQPHLKAEIITMYLLTESSVRQLSAMNVLETWLSLLLFPITVISYNNFIFIIPWQSSKGIWSTLSTIKCYINDSYYNKTVFFFFSGLAFLLCCTNAGSQFPHGTPSRWSLCPLQRKNGVLTTTLPGKSLKIMFINVNLPQQFEKT